MNTKREFPFTKPIASDREPLAESTGDTLLVLKGLSKSYDGQITALENVSLSVTKGELVSIIGRSGAGKSTLLRCVNRLVEPSDGEVFFNGKELTHLRAQALREQRRRISMVFQHYNLVHRSAAIENVLQGRLGYKSSLAGALSLFSEDEKRHAFEVLDQVGMAAYAYTRCDRLSGGQKQRVGIARALVQEPLLILADEPIASLDPRSSQTVMGLLRWVVDSLGIACLVSLHQVEYALTYSDRIIALQEGQLVFDGTCPELDSEAIASIYGDENDAETLTEPGTSPKLSGKDSFDAPTI